MNAIQGPLNVRLLLPWAPFAVPPTDRAPGRAIIEASYAAIKLSQAREVYSKAFAESNRHSEHYSAFPVMKERYEGILQESKKEHDRLKSDFDIKAAVLNQELQKFAAKQASARESEAAIQSAQKLASELGQSTLKDYVRQVAISEIQDQVMW